MKTQRRVETKSSLALAALLSVPLYFAALMASSLALDTPKHPPLRGAPSTGATELKVWGAALLAPAIMLAIGFAALPLRRFGVFVSAVGGVVLCLVLPPLSKRWIPGHIRRFPLGMDFIPDTSPSNLSSRGEWEAAAHATIVSICRYTLVIAIGAIVVGVFLEWRRRRGAEAIFVPPSPATVTGEGEVSPVLELDERDPSR
ncbi:MAG TPA: hypothetical protein VMT59_09135 [Gaiellaceae bacterium]|nr:hypothetical protein [Gaiellaceae bacterium]